MSGTSSPVRDAAPTPEEPFGDQLLQRARPLLGTIVSIRIHATDSAQAHAAIEAGFAAIAEVHRLMSFHERGSDLNRLNREAASRAVSIDPLTLAVLREALQFAAVSNGAFDVTVARELVECGWLPRPRAAWTPDPAASWRDIELLSDGRVRFHRPLWMDLGGIAKGFAVDHAVKCMALAPDIQLCINAGGDLRVCGPRAERVYLKVGVPQEAVPLLALQNGSVASSGGRGMSRRLATQRVGPHIHGVRRVPMGLRSFASVVAHECLAADALTKIVLAQGVRSARVLQQYQATAYLHDVRYGWRTVGTGA